jgi:hypothetical protein
MEHDVRQVTGAFGIEGTFVSAEALRVGHIHDTYVAVFERGTARQRYVVQRINTDIFGDPETLMANIQRVTSHIRGKLEAEGVEDVPRKVLQVIPSRAGGPLHRDEAGVCWRAYPYIEDTVICHTAETPEQAYEAARLFGLFQTALTDLPPPRLAETIPGFHHTPARLAALDRAIAADVRGRAASCHREIAFAWERRGMAHVLVGLNARGAIPERVTHNDTKINNVLMDRATRKALCIIDLDTVMPGLSLYDFGDLVRTSVSPAAEDETGLGAVAVRMPIYEALVRGYLAGTRSFLNDVEKKHLAFSSKLITLEIGIRFLTDYLVGDVYFKTSRPGHNLDRCRTQFRLVEEIERHEAAMEKVAAER